MKVICNKLANPIVICLTFIIYLFSGKGCVLRTLIYFNKQYIELNIIK